jgi:hypothetical protein
MNIDPKEMIIKYHSEELMSKISSQWVSRTMTPA